MPTNQPQLNHPTSGIDTIRFPGVGNGIDIAPLEGASPGEHSSQQWLAQYEPSTAAPVRLPERAQENRIRYRRCVDWDSL